MLDDGSGWPAGYRKSILESVDSTNDEAKRRIDSGMGGPEWILARAQTAGRGRRGRAWASALGNFSATLLLPIEQETPDFAARRSFLAAICVIQTVEALIEGEACPSLSCKWPNDVISQKRKLGGILLEYIRRQDRGFLLIGIGINLLPVPASEAALDMLCPTSFFELSNGKKIDPLSVLLRLGVEYNALEETYRTSGFGPVRAAWLARAAGLGEQITARLGNGQILEGRFEEIDENGLLQLRTHNGVQKISAADVFLKG